MFNKNKDKNYTLDDLIKVIENNDGTSSLYGKNYITIRSCHATKAKYMANKQNDKYEWKLYNDIEVIYIDDKSIKFSKILEPNYCISSDETIENSYIKSIGDLSEYFIEESGNYYIKYRIIKTIEIICDGSTTLEEKELDIKKEVIEVSQINGLEFFKKYIEENGSYYLIETEDEYLDWEKSCLKIETWCWLKVSNLLDRHGLIPSFQIFIDKIGTDIKKYKLAESLIKTVKNTSVLYLAFRDNFL